MINPNESEEKLFCVITTIQAPTDCMETLSKQWPGEDGTIMIVGDSKGPFEYDLGKTTLFDIEEQRSSQWKLAGILPEKHYARKNLGYLRVISEGATTIFETDDDNEPNQDWVTRNRNCESARLSGSGWYNVYREYSDNNIWPRGYPLDEVLKTNNIERTSLGFSDSPLQQGLANGSPDVDAVWRLILDKDIQFSKGDSVRLSQGLWCPFNSQSTWWWKEAYPLMYLPSYCPFRMTDIWRSFVAQRCLWAMGYELTFHTAEMYQSRNPHDYMFDFKDEVPGYLRNEEIRDTLESLDLKAGKGSAIDNLYCCYEALVGIGLIPDTELPLVRAWIEDLKSLGVS